MKKFANARQLKREIDSYVSHFTGAPLVVGIDDTGEYAALLNELYDDPGKRIMRMSERCNMEFPPDPVFHLSAMGRAAEGKTAVWLGVTQAGMFYGQRAMDLFLIDLLGCSYPSPVVVLCPFCCNLLEGVSRNYFKLGYNIAILSSAERVIPTIYFYREVPAFAAGKVAHGMKELLRLLEDGNFEREISVVTSCELLHLENAMFPVLKGMSAYKLLCQREPDIAIYTEERNGTAEQWRELLRGHQEAGSLAALCGRSLCPVQSLANDFGAYLSSDKTAGFLCFISLKVYYGGGGDYLATCLVKASTVDELERAIYFSILDLNPDDEWFSSWSRQRRRMLASLDENDALMKAFCQRAVIKGKDILWYLSDQTEAERAALIHALCCYPYQADELERVLREVSPQLSAYLRPFDFNEFNTKVMASDGYVHPLLTNYFQRYKLQKLTDRQDPDFVELVEEEATTRSFTKLQARSAIVKKLDKNGALPYFFDALGAEFLSFIQTKAEEYGMQFECLIGHCNLPSITSKNKEFYTVFPEGCILKEEKLDEIKHQGTKYDFQFTTEPLHIFDELAVLDRDLKKMRSSLATGKCQQIIILSDHGASRLAVTYRSENDKLQLSEPGQHSGRCCPADADPHIPFATYEDGFAVLANYQRFKGSRKADVETHGGASLEETVVPVIVLKQRLEEQQLFFVEHVVPCSPKNGSVIRLFADPPLKKPRMVIGGQSYEGKFDGDQHNVVFEMPDIRRKGHHEAEILDAADKKGVLTFETVRQTGTNQLI